MTVFPIVKPTLVKKGKLKKNFDRLKEKSHEKSGISLENRDFWFALGELYAFQIH